MSDELPQGWATARISELCDVPKEKGREGVVPYLEIGNVDIASKSYALTGKPSVKGCRIARKNDVLVSKVRPTRGAITWIREPELQVSSAFTVLRNRGALAEKCLWQFLAWNRCYLSHLGENCTGTMYPTTSDEAVVDFEMPLPPLCEQRRIVAKLEKLLGKVNGCQQRLAKLPILLRRFRQSVLAAACFGRLTADWREHSDVEPPSQLIRRIFDERSRRYQATCDKCLAAGTKPPKQPKNLTRYTITRDELPDIPDSWEWVCWDDLADWITYGFTRPMPHVEKGVPIITAKNVRDGFLDFSEPEYTTKEAFNELSEKDKPRRNEILITKDGAIRGRAALVETDEPFCISQAVAVFRFGGLTAYEPFLLRVVQCKFTQNLIEEESMGTAIPHISITNFGRFPVPLPPLAEQQEIVRRAESLFALADQIEARYAKAKAYVEKITPSLLARAFRGELVPQDPNDEPASVLLEKIRQTKTDDHPKRKTKRAAAFHTRPTSNRQFGATNPG